VDIGYVSLQSGRYDQAVLLSQEAANFAISVQAGRQIPMALGNMGWAYENLGDFESALAHFQAAERYSKDAGMTNLQVFWLEDAGLAEHRLGHLTEAAQYDEAALQLASQLPAVDEVDDIVNIETNLALLLYEQGAYDDAQRYSDKAVLASRQSKDDKVIAYALYLQGLIAARQATHPQAERLLMQAHQLTTDGETRMEIENALANLYLAGRRLRQAELWYRKSIQTFEHNRSSVQNEALRLSSFAHGDQVYRDYAEFLIEARRPDEALELLDRSRARTLEEGLGFANDLSPAPGDALDPRAVSRRLNAPLLFYSLGPEKSHLWAVTAGGVHLFTLPKRAEIQSLMEEYQRAILKSADPLQTQSTAATKLYAALVAPAAAFIPEGSRVYVSPDGALHAFNYETLIKPTAAGLRYWIEDVTVTVTSSLRMLSRWSSNSVGATAPRDLLLIGNPIAAGSDFEALPNAATEMDRVQQHFAAPARTVIARARATPAAYAASAPERFTYIHFVAHGTASRSSPLDSAVVLSPAPSSSDDFKLYARDIVQHPLHARLVTISACYGSGLRAYEGEGLVGLAWAFLRAGSHHVISALWEVNDSATPLMMDRLYGEIEAGKAPDAALRSAKLSLIHSPDVYRKPFYWGTFQLYAGA
jgi:CHAT domain-containing protein